MVAAAGRPWRPRSKDRLICGVLTGRRLSRFEFDGHIPAFSVFDLSFAKTFGRSNGLEILMSHTECPVVMGNPMHHPWGLGLGGGPSFEADMARPVGFLRLEVDRIHRSGTPISTLDAHFGSLHGLLLGDLEDGDFSLRRHWILRRNRDWTTSQNDDRDIQSQSRGDQ